MTPRQRQLATIRREIPDRIAIDAICVENTKEVAAHLGIAPEAVLDRLGIDGRVVTAGYTGKVRPPKGEITYSDWGTSGWQFHERREYPLAGASVADIERYPWVPAPADYDYAAAARAAGELDARYAVRGPYWKPLFCQVCDLMGMEAAMLALAGEPPLFEAALGRVFAHVQEYCRRLLAACGEAMPIFCLGDDFATQRGLMISPADWRRLLKPLYARLFAPAKSAGKVVWFHSCGDISAVLGDLVDIGMDVWETVQLHTLPMTPRELKRQYGKHVTFFGGINTQRLPFAEPQEIRAEVRRVIGELGEGGGYICGPDHHVKYNVPPENTVALFDAAMAFRRKGYTA